MAHFKAGALFKAARFSGYGPFDVKVGAYRLCEVCHNPPTMKRIWGTFLFLVRVGGELSFQQHVFLNGSSVSYNIFDVIICYVFGVLLLFVLHGWRLFVFS